MLSFLFSLVVISLSGVMMPGPMFAITIAKSYQSRLAGMQIALGHAVIETPLILLIYFGFAQFFQNTAVRLILSIVGGSMLIWLGITMFRARRKVTEQGKELPYSSFTGGILTSGLNPYFLLWWATIGSLLIMNSLQFGITGLVLLILVHWLCDLIWLSSVSRIVYKTHSLWGRKFQQGLFLSCSLLLTGFGGWFLISALQILV